jgi:hypothetical protein
MAMYGRYAQRLTLKHPGLPQSRFARKEVSGEFMIFPTKMPLKEDLYLSIVSLAK